MYIIYIHTYINASLLSLSQCVTPMFNALLLLPYTHVRTHKLTHTHAQKFLVVTTHSHTNIHTPTHTNTHAHFDLHRDNEKCMYETHTHRHTHTHTPNRICLQRYRDLQ